MLRSIVYMPMTWLVVETVGSGINQSSVSEVCLFCHCPSFEQYMYLYTAVYFFVRWLGAVPALSYYAINTAVVYIALPYDAYIFFIVF